MIDWFCADHSVGDNRIVSDGNPLFIIRAIIVIKQKYSKLRIISVMLTII